MNDLVAAASKERNAIMSTVPLLDPMYFQQVQAVAKMLAHSSIIPRGLLYEKDANNKDVAIPIERVEANCFLISNQAMKWKLEPFGVAQACSIVHGRLMFEGKLVAAVLDANLGVKLHYEFGAWDNAKNECDLSKEGSGDNLAVRVYEIQNLDADGQLVFTRRYIDGFVGGWKTTGNNTPWAPANHRRQLRYRGAREWARAFEPGIMIGVITDDEVDFNNMRDITPAQTAQSGTDVIDRLKGAKSGGSGQDGFDNARVSGQQNTDGEETSAKGEKTVSNSSSPAEGGDAGKSSSSSSNQQQDQGSLLGKDDAPQTDKSGLTEIDKLVLLNVGRMMLAATMKDGKVIGDRVLLDNQKSAASEFYKPAMKKCSAKAMGKLDSFLDRCIDVCEGKLEADDFFRIIPGMLGTTIFALEEKAEEIKL